MIVDCHLVRWLVEPRTRSLPIEAAFTELVEKLDAGGAALLRVGTSLPALHPEFWVRRLVWTREKGAQLLLPEHGITQTAVYRDSPVALIHAGSPPIRCRLTGPDADLRFGICRDLAAAGATDYICAPLELEEGRRTYISLATDAPAGFSERALDEILELAPFLSAWLALATAQYATRGLLEIYLGKKAAERVLAGEVRRGAGSTIQAAIWTCDLRGFTSMSDALPAAEVVASLDRYFEAVGGAIADHEGEILKFIGDAVLAIFPVTDSAAAACARALRAAERAFAAMDALNEARAAAGQPRLAIGLALHLGEVVFGNIGARKRLDFTVIGAAVNEACRMESMCKELGTPLVVSERFAGEVDPSALVPLGAHRLRGVAEPVRLFTLASRAP